MSSPSHLNRSDVTRASARRRSAAFVLTVAAHLLIVLLLLRLGPSFTPPRERPRPPVTFQMLPEPKPEPKAIAEEPVRAETGGSQPRAAEPVPKAAAAAPAAPAPPSPFALMPGGMELFDAADIGKLRSSADDGDGGEGAGAGTAKNSASVYGPGEGPGGERLYDVDWARRPTEAELGPFLPPNRPAGSWAIIACRMLEGNRVENCRSLGESPPGSGLARGLRLAAWQFRVLPPRVGNRKIIGGWVRIRMDFTDRPSTRQEKPLPEGGGR